MPAASGPRLTGGLAASVLVHGAVIGAFFLMRPPTAPPIPPVYSVHILAAPPGARAPGVVQDHPPVASAEITPPTPVPNMATERVANATKKAPLQKKAAPKLALPLVRRAATLPAKSASPLSAAHGGPTGGHGADVANIDTPGIEFDFPPYTNNIVSQLVRRLSPTRGGLSATVRFIIRRDGAVDLESIKIVSSSNDYGFDQRAVGAVESAANAKAFGPLPAAFREDILPVTFRFSPSAIR